MSSKDSDEICTMRTKSNNTGIVKGNDTNDIIEELFESLLQNHQKRLSKKMRDSELVIDTIDLLHYNLHKICLNRSRSYIDSPKWLKNKKTTINPKNNDDKCFQYTITATLNYKQIKRDP